jgi:hypothetical protein
MWRETLFTFTPTNQTHLLSIEYQIKNNYHVRVSMDWDDGRLIDTGWINIREIQPSDDTNALMNRRLQAQLLFIGDQYTFRGYSGATIGCLSFFTSKTPIEHRAYTDTASFVSRRWALLNPTNLPRFDYTGRDLIAPKQTCLSSYDRYSEIIDIRATSIIAQIDRLLFDGVSQTRVDGLDVITDPDYNGFRIYLFLGDQEMPFSNGFDVKIRRLD